MGTRTEGRELALQTLYQVDLLTTFGAEEREGFLRTYAESPDVATFARDIVGGVLDHRKTLDGLIAELSTNWRIERMPIVDRTILRIGAYELLHCRDDIPPKVAIDEAVNLAKKYSTKEAGGFVNGILDRILKDRVGAPGGGVP